MVGDSRSGSIQTKIGHLFIGNMKMAFRHRPGSIRDDRGGSTVPGEIMLGNCGKQR